MATEPGWLERLEYRPVTPERWADLETLFGKQGACAGCWCMWWRLSRSQWVQGRGEGNRQAFKRIVESGEVPGILAYLEGRPVGWCSVAPRQAFSALERSRKLKRIDDEPVWSVTCFFIARQHRRQGITVGLLRAAVDHVRGRGGKIIEGYPARSNGASAFMGMVPAFREVGFVEVAPATAIRSIFRYYL